MVQSRFNGLILTLSIILQLHSKMHPLFSHSKIFVLSQFEPSRSASMMARKAYCLVFSAPGQRLPVTLIEAAAAVGGGAAANGGGLSIVIGEGLVVAAGQCDRWALRGRRLPWHSSSPPPVLRCPSLFSSWRSKMVELCELQLNIAGDDCWPADLDAHIAALDFERSEFSTSSALFNELSTDSLDPDQLHAVCQPCKTDYHLTFSDSVISDSEGNHHHQDHHLTTWGRIRSADPLDENTNSLPANCTTPLQPIEQQKRPNSLLATFIDRQVQFDFSVHESFSIDRPLSARATTNNEKFYSNFFFFSDCSRLWIFRAVRWRWSICWCEWERDRFCTGQYGRLATHDQYCGSMESSESSIGDEQCDDAEENVRRSLGTSTRSRHGWSVESVTHGRSNISTPSSWSRSITQCSTAWIPSTATSSEQSLSFSFSLWLWLWE